jgi:pimeloyl-ACP methyl ester carboxylesterase
VPIPATDGVHHVRQGSGPPLVLIPGTACDWRVWRPVLAPLSAARDVIAVDLPGFGGSPPLEGEAPTPAALARAVARLLDSLGIERAQVAGSSLGGAVAIELARLDRATSVCALAPIGLWTPRESAWVQTVVRASATFIRAPLTLRTAIAGHAALRTLGYGHVVARPWALSREDALALSSVAIPGLEAILAAYRDYRLPGEEGEGTGRRPGRRPAGGNDAPVTVVWGTRDRLLLPRQAGRVARVLPVARVVALPGAGHLSMLDEPDAVVSLILGGESRAPWA